jgi:hypothetical protein
MANNQRPEDPFAKLHELPTDQRLFAVAKGSAPSKQITPKVTRGRDNQRENRRANPREGSSDYRREKPREFPTRDEIQEFSFRLRDTLKVKVQAEVPHEWQTELEEVARALKVRKLELYRFILGEFLGKVRRKKTT